ncbi:hypothetical protein TNCV_1668431 [Trichonephila clavipes]|nr:hypothetical protein TNCV_1668431 [Trichonephila clavipes]
MSSLKQRGNFKFRVVFIEKSPPEIFERLRLAYGNDAMKKAAVYERHKRFREDRKNITADLWSGRRSYFTTDENVERF